MHIQMNVEVNKLVFCTVLNVSTTHEFKHTRMYLSYAEFFSTAIIVNYTAPTFRKKMLLFGCMLYDTKVRVIWQVTVNCSYKLMINFSNYCQQRSQKRPLVFPFFHFPLFNPFSPPFL